MPRGSVNFQYEYERQLPDGEYDYPMLDVEADIDHDPGQYYGPPENCWPADTQVEITSLKWPDGTEWKDPPRDVLDKIEEMAIERWEQER